MATLLVFIQNRRQFEAIYDTYGLVQTFKRDYPIRVIRVKGSEESEFTFVCKFVACHSYETDNVAFEI